MILRSLALTAAFFVVAEGFQSPNLLQSRAFVPASSFPTPTLHSSPLFNNPLAGSKRNDQEYKQSSILRKVISRFDTIESAGLENAKISGIFSKIHGPITYLALALMMGLKWNRCFRNPYYWFAVAFCVKWYRARYVFKIPVWDRQPNWNNIITSKEQEKDLKAFTCKKCGSTLFIAKTREFFFEGDTGIGGLGCFSCGAKGKENFVMDRERIVEDVADMDDYFEYERPLDFVSAAERRKIMKEAGGDEEKANKILLERSGAGDGDETPVDDPQAADNATEVLDAAIEEGVVNGDRSSVEEPPAVEDKSAEEIEEPQVEEDTPVAEVESKVEKTPASSKSEEPKKAEKPKKTEAKKSVKKEEPPSDDFNLDDLGMDDF